MKKEIKKETKKIKEENKKFWGDFKAFISRGNVVDMAVGVIIGGAFGKIVTSLVDDVLMPLIGMLMGGLDFSELTITIKDASINYGLFIQTVIDFLIIAFCIFLMIKLFEKFKKKEEPKKEEVKIDEQTLLLREIRDLLKKKK